MITIVRGGGGGQRVMIEIIINVNDENDGRPLTLTCKNQQTSVLKCSSGNYSWYEGPGVWQRDSVDESCNL